MTIVDQLETSPSNPEHCVRTSSTAIHKPNDLCIHLLPSLAALAVYTRGMTEAYNTAIDTKKYVNVCSFPPMVAVMSTRARYIHTRVILFSQQHGFHLNSICSLSRATRLRFLYGRKRRCPSHLKWVHTNTRRPHDRCRNPHTTPPKDMAPVLFVLVTPKPTGASTMVLGRTQTQHIDELSTALQ